MITTNIPPGQHTGRQPELNKYTLDTLFSHKNEITKKFSDIIGLHFINHIGIFLLTHNNELTLVSSSPSVEFNLIEANLWVYDNSFNANQFQDGHFAEWKNFYHPSHKSSLIRLKESKHGFTFGANLIRQVNRNTLVFSFATRNKVKHAEDYYKEAKNNLMHIGNFAFSMVRDIIVKYNPTIEIPILTSQFSHIKKTPLLRLVKNS